ncbi:MAG: sugar ABC transporter permease [Spirochaetales bacterium]|nr:sugar ABC transporter permease [Spirochaetales bacterium]
MNNTTKDRLHRLQFELAPIYFLAPAMILFTIFVIYPIFQSFWISFHNWSGFGEMSWAGLDNYKTLFKDPKFHISILNTVKWFVFSLLAPVAGLILALFLNQSVRGIRTMKSLFFFPFVINLVVIGLIFSWFYNPDLGLLAEIFKVFHLEPIPVLANDQIATYGVIFASLWPQTAYCMILFLTGLTAVNSQVIEAGRIDGAQGMAMLWHVVLPQLSGATFIAVTVTIIGSLRSFDLIAIMTAGGPWGSTNVLSYMMYDESLFNFKMGYGASIAVILFVLMSGVIAAYLRFVLKGEK